MPFDRPSPFAIRDRLAAEVELALPGADARLRRSMEEVLVRVIAVGSHELHGHLDWISRQILPDTAEDAELARHAAIWGVARLAAAAECWLAANPGHGAAGMRFDVVIVAADGAVRRIADAFRLGD